MNKVQYRPPLRNYHLLLGQIGKPSERRASLAMLLELSDLSEDGWTVRSQRAMRMGMFGYKTEADRRARRAGYFSANRGFKWGQGERRSFVVSVRPYTSVEDAESGAADFRSRIYQNPISEVETTGERMVEGYEVGGATDPWFYEVSTIGIDGRGPGANRFISTNVDRVTFYFGCAAYDSAWPWSDAIAMAELQVAKIRRALNL
ncbi:MAG: hypothetical protein WCF24_04815 [Acidimicrobiales bacterium]